MGDRILGVPDVDPVNSARSTDDVADVGRFGNRLLFRSAGVWT